MSVVWFIFSKNTECVNMSTRPWGPISMNTAVHEHLLNKLTTPSRLKTFGIFYVHQPTCSTKRAAQRRLDKNLMMPDCFRLPHSHFPTVPSSYDSASAVPPSPAHILQHASHWSIRAASVRILLVHWFLILSINL